MESIDFHVGDLCQRQIDGVWYDAEVTKIFETVASVVYSDDLCEDGIPLDHDNLRRRPFVTISPTTTMEDSGSSRNERRQNGIFVEVGISSTSTSPISLSEDDTSTNVQSYINDEQVSYELSGLLGNLGVDEVTRFKFEFDNIQSVPYSDLAQYDKKDFTHTRLPNGDVRLNLLFIPRCGDLHSARSITKYLKMDYYWRQSQSPYEQERYLIPDLKPLAGLCIMCENWTIFGCSRCFNAFYCNRKCQQKGWAHHKVYCENARSFNASSFSKCNEYLQSVVYVPKQRRVGVFSAGSKKKLSVTTTTNSCGTSTQQFHSGSARVYPEPSALVHPYDDSASGERRVYTSPTTGGRTRKVYDIHNSERPTNNSRAPPHHGSVVSSNPWVTDLHDELDTKRHGGSLSGVGEGTLPPQWDWNNTSAPVQADAFVVGGDVDSEQIYRVGSNNSLYCAHSPGRGSPIVEEGEGEAALFDDDLEGAYSVGYHQLDIEEGAGRDDFSAYNISGLSTPPAQHSHYNTRSSAKGDQRSFDRGDVNSLMCSEVSSSQRLNPLNFSSLQDSVSQESLYDFGAMGRRDRSGCRSPSTQHQYHHSPLHHARFQDNGYVSDSEVPALIPTQQHGVSDRVTEIDDAVFEESVKNLVDGMGLNETLVREALKMFSGDLEQAVDYVLNASTWD